MQTTEISFLKCIEAFNLDAFNIVTIISMNFIFNALFLVSLLPSSIRHVHFEDNIIHVDNAGPNNFI